MKLSVAFGEDEYWVDGCTEADMHFVLDALETVATWREGCKSTLDPDLLPIDIGDESV